MHTVSELLPDGFTGLWLQGLAVSEEVELTGRSIDQTNSHLHQFIPHLIELVLELMHLVPTQRSDDAVTLRDEGQDLNSIWVQELESAEVATCVDGVKRHHLI